MTQSNRAFRLVLLTFTALALVSSCSADLTEMPPGQPASGDPNLVVTPVGSFRGASTATMRSFKGIPYAAPPVGALRWKPPTPAPAAMGERDATKLATHCPQPASPFGSAMNTSEDCLYLNVYTPTTAGPHPVMVWIHGGAFYLGQSDEYDPTPLVNKGIVVVTINYRLGALGFMGHPLLTAEGGGTSSNYGLMDQQLALHWVQNNIQAFGGDKGNVTIFGESAGGFSVHSQLVLTGAAGLFQRAIIQSGAYANEAGRQPTLMAAEAMGVSLLKAAGCADPCSLDAMRALSADAIVAAQASVQSASGWVPAVDGKIMPMGVGAAIKAGAYQKVPIMEGSNHDEYRLFVALNEMTTGPLTADNYVTAMKTVFGDQAGPLLAMVYMPAAYNGSAALAQAAAGTDAVFACPSLRASQALAAGGPVYTYEFNDPKAPQIFLPPASGFEYGAAHASEIQYLFNLPKSVLAPDQRALADQMVGYWTNFAKTGDPNGMGMPAWPAYTSAANGILSLAPGTPGTAITMNFSADHKCDLISPPMP